MTTREWLDELTDHIRAGHVVRNADAVRLIELLRRTQTDVQGNWDAWQQEMGKVRSAEAALAQCQHDLGTMANKVEQADATLDACWGKLDDMTAQRDALRIAYDDQAAGWNRAEAALATERIALREFAKGALLRTMHDLSEACWCAGWLHGMEYFLWNVVENGKATEWGMDNVYQRDVDDLRRLRELADGWWIWGETKFETFISLDEMRRLAQAQP